MPVTSLDLLFATLKYLSPFIHNLTSYLFIEVISHFIIIINQSNLAYHT